jgi:pimeloyl-ACP methyl ester carboxylesterase
MAFLYDSISALNPPATAARAAAAPEPYLATDEKLAKMGVPMLFIGGSEDVIFPPELLRYAASLVPGARFVKVRGSGHSVYFEDPATFNRLVMKFFEEAG